MLGRKDQIQALLTWVWNLGLIMDFSSLVSWAPLHDLTTSWFPRFFFFFGALFRNLEFCLFCCSVTLSWLGLHSDPCAEVDRGKSNRGIHYPFEIITLSNRKILLCYRSCGFPKLVATTTRLSLEAKGNYLLWVNYKCSDFVLFWSSEEINMNCVQSIA